MTMLSDIQSDFFAMRAKGGVVIPAQKRVKREELAGIVDQFLQNGGRVEVLPPCTFTEYVHKSLRQYGQME
jgi:hypothetical protein